GFEPLPPGLRAWLGRALQLDVHNAFPSAIEARAELDRVLGDSDFIASPSSLEALLARYQGAFPVLMPKLAPGPTPVSPAIPDKPAAAPMATPKEAQVEKDVPPAVRPQTRREPEHKRQSGVRSWQLAGLAALLIALVLGGILARGYFASP